MLPTRNLVEIIKYRNKIIPFEDLIKIEEIYSEWGKQKSKEKGEKIGLYKITIKPNKKIIKVMPTEISEKGIKKIMEIIKSSEV
jgi:hypothetical protein